MTSTDDYRRERAADPRSNEELIAIAAAKWGRDRDDDDDDDDDDDVGTRELGIIAARGGRAELDLLMDLSRSPTVVDREIAAFTMGQMGFGEHVFPDEIGTRLLELTRDPETSVVSEAVYGLGHKCWPAAVPRLIELAVHADDDVRHAVACALPTQGDVQSVPTILLLMRDACSDVRDWATFAFFCGFEEIDSKEIREALIERTDDEDSVVRGEALRALAHRHDPRAVERIRRELGREIEDDLVFRAADLAGDRALLPELELARNGLDDGFSEYQLKTIDEIIARLRASG